MPTNDLEDRLKSQKDEILGEMKDMHIDFAKEFGDFKKDQVEERGKSEKTLDSKLHTLQTKVDKLVIAQRWLWGLLVFLVAVFGTIAALLANAAGLF